MTKYLCVVAWFAAAGPATRGNEPTAGTVRTVPVVSVALEVGSTEKDEKRAVYAPPPGWYIRSHRVECARRHGRASYAVSTVPAGWRWASEATATGSERFKAAAAGTGHVAGYGELAGEVDAAAAASQRTRASHHSLVVDVSARGGGFLRGGGGIELTVVAEMVYVGGRSK